MSKISQYPVITSPPTSMEMLGTDVTDTTEGPTGTTKIVTIANLVAAAGGGGGGSAGGAPTAWFNAVTQYSADPTGATDTTSHIQAAITAAAASSIGYGVVYLPAGTYKISGGFNLPVNVTLTGDESVGGTVTSVYQGTVLEMSSSFSGSYVLGISEVSNNTVNGATVRGLMINGLNYTAAPVHGIQITGPAITVLRDIRITQVSGWGIWTIPDLSAGEIGCYGQDWDNILIDSTGQGGISLVYAEDSTFRDCYVIGCNGGPGWQIAGADNSHFSDCRAEWNSQYGWWITNITVGGNAYNWTFATGSCQFSNCSTDRSTFDGMRIDATWTTGSGVGTGPCTIQVSGMVNRRDGKANSGAVGSYAGLALVSTNLPVIFTGFSQCTGIDDGGTGNQSPRYGVFLSGVGSTVPVLLGPGVAWGMSAGVSGTATGLVSTAVNQQTGISSSSTI